MQRNEVLEEIEESKASSIPGSEVVIYLFIVDF